jgi:iron(III) transport system ATP-binding protein
MITIANLSKSFQSGGRTIHALKTVSVEINAGEFFVLLGASGSGKTTLIRCVAGLEHANAGEISLGGRSVYSGSKRITVPPEERNIGMVFQSYAIWPHLTVFENVALPLQKGRKRLAPPAVKARVAAALEAVELQGLESRPVPMLSGGQQQRVALARALAVEPDALLMDEPLSNLDARLREKVRGQIREIAKRFGITVLYVTHDQTEAMALADRLAVLADGEVQQIGRPHELYRQPRTPEVAEFFGDMNWLTGRLSRAGVVDTAIGPICVDGCAFSDGSAVRLGIRPENIVLCADAIGAANCFRGKVKTVTFFGERQSVTVDIGTVSIVMRTSGTTEIAASDLWVHFPETTLLVFADAG